MAGKATRLQVDFDFHSAQGSFFPLPLSWERAILSDGGWGGTSHVEGKDDDIEGDTENPITAVMRGETYLKTTTDRKDVPLQDETRCPGPVRSSLKGPCTALQMVHTFS